MADVAIRRLEGDEKLEVMYDLTSYSLHASPPLPDREAWLGMVGPRQRVTYMALFEDGVPASGAAATAMTQNVRGKLFAANGVWGVATTPQMRRKGYCRAAIAELLSAARDEGQVFSTLYPFRESFYERLGYVTFPLPRIARFAPAALSPLVRSNIAGQVTCDLIGHAFDDYYEYLRHLRARTHGMGVFSVPDKNAARRNRFWLARAVTGGETVGVMLYSLQGDEDTHFLIKAVRFYYDTPQARWLLLQWIARHVDQADRVEVWLAPAEQPETWLADLQVKAETDIRSPMARVVDVAGIGGLAAGAGRFAARISDPLCPWNNAVWEFASDGALGVSEGDRADCDLSIQGLAALLYGTLDPSEFSLRGWGNPPPAIQAVMRAMFLPASPHLHERF